MSCNTRNFTTRRPGIKSGKDLRSSKAKPLVASIICGASESSRQRRLLTSSLRRSQFLAQMLAAVTPSQLHRPNQKTQTRTCRKLHEPLANAIQGAPSSLPPSRRIEARHTIVKKRSCLQVRAAHRLGKPRHVEPRPDASNARLGRIENPQAANIHARC